MANDYKALIQQEAEKVLEQLPESTLIFARPFPMPPYQPYSLIPSSRIIAVLSGRKPIGYTNGEDIIDTEMGVGDVLYAEPYGWTNPLWTKQHTFLSIVFHHNHIRFLYIKNIPEFVTSPHGPDSRYWYHTSHGLCRTGTMLLSALNSLGAEYNKHELAGIEILTALVRIALDQFKSDKTEDNGKAHNTWQNIRNFMRENSHMQITRESVASHFMLNPSYLSRLFQKHGEGFNSYLRRLRLEQARHMLEQQDLTIDEISYRCGFNSTGYFIKTFANAYGTTPGFYRSGSK